MGRTKFKRDAVIEVSQIYKRMFGKKKSKLETLVNKPVKVVGGGKK